MNMIYHDALACWQNSLRQVLSDYVNGDFLRVRMKWAFPGAWGISAYAAEYALRKLVYAAYPLASYVKTPALSTYLDQLDSPPSVGGDPEMALLEALTKGYRLLAELVSHEHDLRADALHLEREFDVDTYIRIDRAYLSPVIRLTHIIRQRMAPYLSLAALHGSMGDLKYAKGYSDLDTWLVLDEATVTDAARLRQFAKECYRSLTEIYRFDPLQHHGHMVATAIDLRWYPESWLPVETFQHACSILPGRANLEILVRDSGPDARRNFDELQELMHLRHILRWSPATAYELKDYLSILMLAPAQYLQAKGLYVSKQASFQIARDHLPNANWDAVRYATQARSAWPYYRSRLMEVVRPPNVFWVNAFQRARARKVYQSPLASFPEACLSSAAELTQQMADDVECSTPRFHALKQGCTAMDVPLHVVNPPLVRAAHDYEETRKRYVAAVQQERAVLGVYQYGNVSYPGLSDLDFVLCVSEAIEPIGSTRLAVEALSPLDQNVMLHSPTVVPVSQIPYLPEFLVDAAFHKIWETRDLPVGLPALSPAVNTYAKLAKLFETLLADRIWISEVLKQRTLDARWAIPSLKSIVYSCDTLESVSGNVFAWASDYRTAIQELRANWFLEESQTRQHAALRAVFRHGLQVVLSLISEFDNFVQHRGWLTDPGTRQSAPVTLPLVNATITFEDRPASDASWIIAHPRQINLSNTFWKLLDIYLQAADHWGDWGWTPAAQTEFRGYVQERLQKIGQQMRFLKRHRMNFGGYLPWQLEQLLSGARHWHAESAGASASSAISSP